MVSLPLRCGEPWRSNALKAPPRRSTGALLAGCAQACLLECCYDGAGRACQPDADVRSRTSANALSGNGRAHAARRR